MEKQTALLLCLMFEACILSAQIRFTDATTAAGINHQFVVYDGMFGGGACVLDVNNDGFDDLYLTSGMNDDQLLLNQKDGTFRNAFEGSGLELTKKYVTEGVTGADVNRDGWVDLFITTITTKGERKAVPRAENLLFLNQGNGKFKNATKEYGLEDLYSFSTGCSFGDFNADGFPDLYVGNYFLDYDGPLTEINDATIVNASKTAEGYLLLNKNGKAFKDVYSEYGLNHRGFGFGGLFTDYDNDGDQDLMVLHDFGYKAKPNYLLRNNYPDKSFTYIEKEAGLDLRINAMTAAVGDYDNNGFLDYFITNIKFNRFMVSGGAGKPYTDKAEELGTSMFTISWGANFADFDHDGDLDLFVANGDLNPNCQPMGDYLFENNTISPSGAGNGKVFTDVARAAGIQEYGIGRGSVIFDIENDGDMDLLVVNQKAVKNYPVPTVTKLFRNDSTHGNWLKVALDGVHAEKHGIGSRVTVVAGGQRMIREVDGGGSSHLSQNSTTVHFGLGDATTVDSIIVTWLGGKRQVLTGQGANQLLTIKEEGGPNVQSGDGAGKFNTRWLLIGIAAVVAMFAFFKNRRQ
jgi:enediyne biosynthesis protein E4